MTPGIKLALFGAAVAAAFGVGAAVGAAVGPIDVGGETHTSISVPDAEGLDAVPGSGPAHGEHG